jgi:integrator complex subunit 3
MMSSVAMDGPGMSANSKTPVPSVTMNGRKNPPKLFISSVLEPRDELDERHEKCYAVICALTADKSEKEAHEAMAAAVSAKDPKAHEDVCLGLVVGILGDPEVAARHYRDLTLVSRDGMTFAINHLSMLVLDKYTRMLPNAKQQLLWLTREMIKGSLQGMENICWNLMRQIAGGDVSRPNLWLADQLLDILIENRAWLERFPFLLASVVYTYLRVMEDHAQYAEKLKEKEVPFIVSLIRERFTDVIVIGRDFMRVLQHVAKIPEIEQLWNDILNNPKCLSPTYTGITQIMQTRTSRRFLQSRVTPEMEKKLVFLTSHVSWRLAS